MPLMVSVLTSAFVSAQTVKIDYPDGSQKDFDCSTLAVEGGKLWLTCDAAEALDINNQEICNYTDNMPNDAQGRKNKYSLALYAALVHFGRMHNDCVGQAGVVDKKFGNDPDAIYGPGWENKKQPCTIIQARDGCATALGMK